MRWPKEGLGVHISGATASQCQLPARLFQARKVGALGPRLGGRSETTRKRLACTREHVRCGFVSSPSSTWHASKYSIEMSTQDADGIPFELRTEEEFEHYRLLELPAELLSFLTSENPPA